MSDSTTTTRSAAEIEAELAATREQLTETLAELVQRVQPASLVEDAKDAAAQKVDDAIQEAKDTVEKAQQGDEESLKKLGIVAGVAVGITALITWRIVAGVRRRRREREILQQITGNADHWQETVAQAATALTRETRSFRDLTKRRANELSRVRPRD